MKRKKFSSPRIWLWILGIVALLGSLVGGVAWYLNKKSWQPLLENQLKTLVLQASDSLYTISYKSINLNLVTGNADIKDFKLIPNDSVYNTLLKLKKAPDNLYDLQVSEVTIRNFHPKDLYRQKKLNVDLILIKSPTLNVTNRPLPYNNIKPEGKAKTLYQIISPVFKEIKITGIKLRDIDFALINKQYTKPKKTAIKNLNISISDVLIDSVSEQDTKRFYHTGDIEVGIKDYTIATADKLYYLAFKNVSFSSQRQQLKIRYLGFVPRLSKINFYKRVGYAKDRFNVDFYNLSFNGINLKQFLHDQRFYATGMNIGKANVEVYNNTAYPKRRRNKTGKYPHQQLQKLALNLRINRLTLANTNISYGEYNAVSKQTGKITFNNTYGTIYNVTNDSTSLSRNRFMKARLHTTVLSSGKLTADFNFNLTDPLGAFACAAVLRNMDGRDLNKITKPLGLIEIESADISKLKFSFSGNERLAKGNLNFFYKNLKVNVLKRDGETGKLKKQGFISKVANAIIIKESNPDKKGRFTPGAIYFERPGYVSFFSFLWQSIFTGLKQSVGVSRQKESDIKKVASEIGSFIERVKEKREEKKTERKQKRDERRKKKEIKKLEKEEEKKK